MKTQSRPVIAWGWGWEQELIANGHRRTFCHDGNVLELDCSDLYSAMNLSKIPELYSYNGMNIMVCKLYLDSTVDLKKKRKGGKNQTRSNWCRKYIPQEPPRPETGKRCHKEAATRCLTTQAAASSCAVISCAQERSAKVQSPLKPGPQASSPMEEGHFSNSSTRRRTFCTSSAQRGHSYLFFSQLAQCPGDKRKPFWWSAGPGPS